MKNVQVEKREIDYKQFVRRSARETDYDRLIDKSAIIRDGEQIIGIYMVLPTKPHRLVDRINKLQMGVHNRTQGLKSRSKIFGYMPRETIRKDYCSSTALARDDPETHSLIAEFGQTLAKYYKRWVPDVYDFHESKAKDKILDQWRIPGTPFTSGIINKNTALKYHFDSGNFKDVYSNMVAWRYKVVGGHLAIPEYNIGLEIADNSVVFFDGQKIMHGVTPIKYLSPKGYRYSLVFYTLRQMWRCQPFNKEFARIKQVKSNRELNRYKRLTGEIPNKI